MATVDISAIEDSLVLHFGGDFERINAYTLATTLVGLADAAKAANAAINPGYEIEIVVEALGRGSFRTKVRALYRGAGNLFSGDSLRNIILSIIAAFIYEHTLAPDHSVTVNVDSREVVIIQGETRIVVPRQVYEATQQLESVPAFRQGVGRALKAVDDDPVIRTLGLSPNEVTPAPVDLSKDHFAKIEEAFPVVGDGSREVEEEATLRIVRAILERSKRRWEFVWNGVRIPAPVLDDRFYDQFFGHRITIAPGDALKVRLRIRQRLNPDIGVFLNETYEVIEVLKHIPRSEQDSLELGA